MVQNNSSGDRLRIFALSKYQSIKEFADLIGMDSGNVQKYLNEKRKPGSSFLKRLQKEGCDINWLLTGEGEMYAKKKTPDFAQAAGAEFVQKAGEEFARPAGDEFAKPAGAEFARSAAAEFAKPAGAEFARPAGSEFAQKALYRGADAAKSSVPEHSPPIHPPVNAQLTEVLSRLETLEQRYKAMDRTKPYFLLAIGRLLAVQEENISEGDLLIIDPCATPAKNDLIIIKTPEGTKISRHTSTDPALMGVVVKLIREYRQAE